MSKQSLITLLIIAQIIIMFAMAKFCSAPVKAQEDEALLLTQCIRAECNDCKKYWQERAAIAHVILKRNVQYNYHGAGYRTFGETIRSYCSVFRKRSRRAYRIRNSSWDKPLHGNKVWWREMRQWSNQFVYDPESIPDPTPRAMHWGGPSDDYRAHRNGWRLVTSYHNRFWAVR